MHNVAEPLPSPFPLAAATFFPVSAGAGDAWDPGTREYMGRGTLAWNPVDAFDATLKVSYGNHKDNGTTTQQYCLGGHAVTIAGIPDPTNDCVFDNKLTSTGVPPQFVNPLWGNMNPDGKPHTNLETFLSTLTANYRTENLTFTSVSGFMRLRYQQSNNYDQTSYGLANSGIGENTKVFSQEIRLVSDFKGPFNFTLGGYYENSRRTNDTDTLIFFVGPVPAGFPGAGRFDNFASANHNKGETFSAFGQARIDILPKLELAGGVRYTHEKRTLDSGNSFIHPFVLGPTALGNLVPVGESVTGKFTDNNWSPEVTLTYKPHRDMMIYAAYKTGYKSGGFPSLSLIKLNPDGSVPTGKDIGFGPEKAKGFEGGVKAQIFEGTLRLEATAYTYKYIGLQQSVFNPPTFSFFIKNAASARIKGVEVAGTWLTPIEHLQLNASVAYNHASYLNFANAQCYTAQTVAQGCNLATNSQDLSGRSLPRAPRWNAIYGATYDTPITDKIWFGFNFDVNYTSQYLTQETQPPFAVQKEFTLINAAVRFHTPDDKYELALIGRNLADKYYVQVSTATTFSVTEDNLHAATPRPREVRLQATYRW
jgi:outer membrane receptor protein involved in Fe transport